MTTSTVTGSPLVPAVFAVLARQEMRHYLRHKLFWFGAVLNCLLLYVAVLGVDDTGYSSLFIAVAHAMLIGVFGVSVMAGLTRRSDRAAAASGTVAVPQRTRTLALASAAVIPGTLGLITWLAIVIGFYTHPPTVNLTGISDAHIIIASFGQTVLACIGGPLLGLVVGRWLPQRGAAPMVSVLLVLFTAVCSGNFVSWQAWRLIAWWTYWWGPMGWSGGEGHATLLTGSALAWVGYQATWCGIAVLVALYRDEESDRPRLRKAIAGALVLALVLLLLAVNGGLDAPITHKL